MRALRPLLYLLPAVVFWVFTAAAIYMDALWLVQLFLTGFAGFLTGICGMLASRMD